MACLLSALSMAVPAQVVPVAPVGTTAVAHAADSNAGDQHAATRAPDSNVRVRVRTNKQRHPGTASLGTIVVSARHRNEVLRDVPMAITALDADELATRGAEDLTALTAAVPNVVVYPARTFNNAITAYIRGIGQSETVWGVEPGVGVYIDDVYLARPQAALLDVLDVERIEVLRGPQGTLYGKNTIGGAIRYLTRPVESELAGSAAIRLGDHGRTDLKAVLNLPLGDAVATRIAVASFERDGFGHNLLTGARIGGRNAAVARAALDWRLSDRANVRLAWDGYRDRSGPRPQKRLSANRFDPAHTPPDPGNYDERSGMPPLDETDAGGWSATLDWTLPAGWQLKSITADRNSATRSNLDFDLLPAQISGLTRRLQESQRSQEVRLQGRAFGADALFGLYLFDGSAGGRVGSIRSNSYLLSQGEVGTRSAALYADATWQPTLRLGIEAGFRYTRETKSARVLNQGYADIGFTRPTSLVFANFSDSTRFGSLAPKFNVSWKLGGSALLYAQVARGYKAGGYNIRANTRFVPSSGRPFLDETMDTFELGAKTSRWDQRLVIDGALFRNHYRNIQLSVFTAYDSNGDGLPDAFFGDFRNAGAGTVDGAELELQAQVRPWLRVLGHAGYLDAAYDQYVSGGVDIARSQRFTNTPRWSGGASIIAQVHDAHGGDWIARVDANVQSKVYPTTELSEALAQPGYGLLDATLTWRPGSRRWQLVVSGQNLTDRAYRSTGWDIPVLGIQSAYYGPPRTVSATWTVYIP